MWAWICCTPFSWSRTAELSPPQGRTTPCYDGSIFQNCSKGPVSGLNLLHTSELILNCRTVTTTSSVTPGNDGSIFQNRRKGRTSGLNLLHTLQLISNCWTVTAILCMTPDSDCAMSLTPQGQGTFCCCQMWLKYQSCKALSVLYLCFF